MTRIARIFTDLDIFYPCQSVRSCLIRVLFLVVALPLYELRTTLITLLKEIGPIIISVSPYLHSPPSRPDNLSHALGEFLRGADENIHADLFQLLRQRAIIGGPGIVPQSAQADHADA